MDPINVATGGERRSRSGAGERAGSASRPVVEKKKAGFYLSLSVLDRFTRKFHELKLAGAAIENKSALVEMALAFALDDLDKGNESHLLKRV
ncbi:MAG: hypothetical protein GY859_08495 [Desulfobacterales bacterium]|nr:hypothetical protein [Desulfobacterales bacterium]